MTNCLNAITTNTAKFGGGTVMKKTYTDATKKIDELNLFDRNIKRNKKRTAEQIIVDIVARSGLKLSHKKGGKLNESV